MSTTRKITRSTAEVRRDQLLEIASRIIETEGVEALRPTRVAELAGCTRPLIYQYFPRREDIFIAITEDFYRHLDASVGLEAQTDVMSAAARGDLGPVHTFLSAVWQYIDDHGPASLILRSTPEISAEFRVYLTRIRETYEQRWLEAYRALGLDDGRAELLNEIFIVITKVLALQTLAGKITRVEAMDRQVRCLSALLAAGLLGEPAGESLGSPST